MLRSCSFFEHEATLCALQGAISVYGTSIDYTPDRVSTLCNGLIQWQDNSLSAPLQLDFTLTQDYSLRYPQLSRSG